MLRSDEDERKARNQEDHHRMVRQEGGPEDIKNWDDVLFQEL